MNFGDESWLACSGNWGMMGADEIPAPFFHSAFDGPGFTAAAFDAWAVDVDASRVAEAAGVWEDSEGVQ
jgi:hypothetical protein